jgi:hypothetical protein
MLADIPSENKTSLIALLASIKERLQLVSVSGFYILVTAVYNRATCRVRGRLMDVSAEVTR